MGEKTSDKSFLKSTSKEKNIKNADVEMAIPEIFTKQKREQVLVIKLGALGDVIQSFGLLKAINKHHPKARITVLTTAIYADLFRLCPYTDDVHIDTRAKITKPLEWMKLRGWFTDKKFVHVYDLQNNDRTRAYKAVYGGKAKANWHGLTKGEKDAAHDTHAFKRDCTVLNKANITSAAPDDLRWLDGSISIFSVRTPYVLFVPGCAPSRPEKRWAAKHYGRLAQFLRADGFQPVIIGTDHDEDAARIITDICPESLSLIGQTNFAEIASLARGAAAATGNDTGPMHIIGATNCPALVLFSDASDPKRNKPLGTRVNTLQANNIDTLAPEKVLKYIKPRLKTKKRKGLLH